MMIPPEIYYERFIEGKSADEIRDRIQELKETIAALEYEIEHPNTEWAIDPGPDVRLKCNQLYLERAEQALREVEAEA